MDYRACDANAGAIPPKKTRKWAPKNKRNFFWGIPTTPHFFGSLEVPEHEKSDVHALSVAKLVCRSN